MQGLTFNEHRGSLPGAFHPFADPEALALLQELPSNFLAIGASRENCPVGLGIAKLQSAESAARLLTLRVSPTDRGQGIGRQIMKTLDASLLEKGVRTVSAEYIGSVGMKSETGDFLEKCGFMPSLTGISIWSGSIDIMRELDWVRNMQLPSSFSLGSWAGLTKEERDEVREGEGVWYPPILSPFADEDSIDSTRSLVLRFRGVVAGWLILEKFDADTVSFKTMFVRKRHQRMGRGIAMIAHACRELFGDILFPNAVFFVEAQNEDMIRFMNSRMSHPQIKQEALWRTYKLLPTPF